MKKKEKQIIEILQDARLKLMEATVLIEDVDVSEKVGEEYRIRPEFEKVVEGIHGVYEAVCGITCDRKEKGAFDYLKEKLTEKLKEFFREQYKLKKYEGDRMNIGYVVKENKIVTDEADDTFVRIERKPNTAAINAYMKATRSEEHPDGELPKGVEVKRFEYITWKTISNEE